jgi:hypothetical protein
MWFPAINTVSGEKAWRNLVLPKQLLDSSASASLLSTEACQDLGMLSFFQQRCAVMKDGWIVPFAGSRGFYFDVIYACPLSPPPVSMLPVGLALSEHTAMAHKLWMVATSTGFNLAGRGNSQSQSKLLLI